MNPRCLHPIDARHFHRLPERNIRKQPDSHSPHTVHTPKVNRWLRRRSSNQWNPIHYSLCDRHRPHRHRPQRNRTGSCSPAVPHCECLYHLPILLHACNFPPSSNLGAWLIHLWCIFLEHTIFHRKEHWSGIPSLLILFQVRTRSWDRLAH